MGNLYGWRGTCSSKISPFSWHFSLFPKSWGLPHGTSKSSTSWQRGFPARHGGDPKIVGCLEFFHPKIWDYGMMTFKVPWAMKPPFEGPETWWPLGIPHDNTEVPPHPSSPHSEPASPLPRRHPESPPAVTKNRRCPTGLAIFHTLHLCSIWIYLQDTRCIDLYCSATLTSRNKTSRPIFPTFPKLLRFLQPQGFQPAHGAMPFTEDESVTLWRSDWTSMEDTQPLNFSWCLNQPSTVPDGGRVSRIQF